MHRAVIIFFVALLYYTLVSFGLYIFDATYLLTTMFIFGFPALVLAKFSVAPTPVVTSIVALGVGIAFLLEGVGMMYGLWYVPSVETLRIFGVVSIEVLIGIVLQVLFVTLLYEVMFDDGQYTESSARIRFSSFGVFAISMVVLVAVYQYIFTETLLKNPYVFLTIFIVSSCGAMLIVSKTLNRKHISRLLRFSVIASIPLLLSTIVTGATTQKIFVSREYWGMVNLFGTHIPYEEILLSLALPFFIATVYELYLDDKT